MGPFSKQTFVRRTRLVIALSGLAATALTGVAQAQFQDDGAAPPSVLEVGKRPIVKFETETYDMVQAKLCMLFTLGEPMRTEQLAAVRLAMALYGGSVTSRLFLNVRERDHLCY